MAGWKHLTLVYAFYATFARINCNGIAVVGYENVKTNLPGISSFVAPSMLVCLHKCALNEVCNIACAQHSSSSRVTCNFSYLENLSNIKHHLYAKKGFSVHVLQKTKAMEKQPTPTQEPKKYPECTFAALFYLKMTDQSMYLAYNGDSLILTDQKAKAEKVCIINGGKNMYLTDQKKCLTGASGSLGMNSDCTALGTEIKFVDTTRVKYDTGCLQAINLDAIVVGTTLAFKSECNDSRVQFTTVSVTSD
ncbi:uncharacterized protein LOC135691884 [Rhopilema esculentum]|uniref:uncharacterized protein LOC135691884 n=1 Tax=Rhopilema esculentum TaxID=499914 RepID=UPI0031D893B1|eukprot:gene9332-17034_t